MRVFDVQSKRFIPLVLVIFGILFSLLLGEAAYRVWRHFSRTDNFFRLGSYVYGQFDEKFGQRFVPHSQLIMSGVARGRVVWCPGIVLSANGDGLGGKTTLAEAKARDFVIFTTGDSFSHWKRSGLTIPDVVESLLNERIGQKVANLNFARGTYGMLQMLTIAAEMAQEIKPDLIVIQFIGDDLTRGRWWTKEAMIDGRKRYLISSRPDGFSDKRITNDEIVVDERASDAWCNLQLDKANPDSVLREATTFYSNYLREKELGFHLFSLSKSYLADYLSLKFVGQPFHARTRFSVIPRVTPTEFANDSGYLDALTKLKEYGIPIVLIHLPTVQDLRSGKPGLTGDGRRIWMLLEENLGSISTWFDLADKPTVPDKIDLMPYDGHPNLDGIKFYGEYVSSVVLPHIRLAPK